MLVALWTWGLSLLGAEGRKGEFPISLGFPSKPFRPHKGVASLWPHPGCDTRWGEQVGESYNPRHVLPPEFFLPSSLLSERLVKSMMVHCILETVAFTLPLLYFSGGQGHSEISEIIWGQNQPWRGRALFSSLLREASVFFGWCALWFPETEERENLFLLFLCFVSRIKYRIGFSFSLAQLHLL